MDARGFTVIFLIAILGILMAGLYFRLAKKKTNKVIALLPNVAVSLGILGTFVGIYLGLLEFDVAKISDSIPKLLDGLKTAFSTSIAGMLTSLILKFTFEGKNVHAHSGEVGRLFRMIPATDSGGKRPWNIWGIFGSYIKI